MWIDKKRIFYKTFLSELEMFHPLIRSAAILCGVVIPDMAVR